MSAMSPSNDFMQRVAERILPLSVEHMDVKQAFTEWEYEGVHFDLGEPSADCELCDHPDIRFQFEIVNKHNANKLLVGSQCIERFEIGGLEGMEKVQKDLARMYETARNKRVMAALDALVAKIPDLAGFRLAYTKENGFFPKQLLVILPKLVSLQIPFLPQDFTIRLRREKDKQVVFDANEQGYEMLFACMSPEQRKKYPVEKWTFEHTRAIQRRQKAEEFKALQEKAYKERMAAMQARQEAYGLKAPPVVSVIPPPSLPKPPTPPIPKPFGLKSKYHGKCPACGKDTFEQLIQKTARGWEHKECAVKEAHAP